MEKPILFSTEMVKAILAGNKTMTRRVVKPQALITKIPATVTMEHSPYGCPGDLLWIRETWREPSPLEKDQVYYKAGQSGATDMKWKPSIHMPKKFCRIWLKVISVRVERLQEITHCNAISEGVRTKFSSGKTIPTPVKQFKALWNEINGKPRKNGKDISWNSNQWVWVVEFERTEKPQAAKEEN